MQNILEGVTVVSLAINLPKPLAAARMCELGAAVTKVEPAAGGPMAAASPAWCAELTPQAQAMKSHGTVRRQLLHGQLPRRAAGSRGKAVDDLGGSNESSSDLLRRWSRRWMIEQTRVSYDGAASQVPSVRGTGTPIVLVHGYVDSAGARRAVVVRLQNAGRRSLAVDLAGRGRAGQRARGSWLPPFDACAAGVMRAGAHGAVGDFDVAVVERGPRRLPSRPAGKYADWCST